MKTASTAKIAAPAGGSKREQGKLTHGGRARYSLAASLVLGLVAAACGHDRPPAAAAPPPAPQTTLTSAEQARSTSPRSTSVSPSVSVSSEISQACHLTMTDVTEAPKFPFDQSDLLEEDYKALDRIAQCLTTGPLAGRDVVLTGRADARGTEEYNMALGARRAHTVSTYLSSLGVNQNRMQESSRGELDAVGTDVLGRKQDRRVDIRLK